VAIRERPIWRIMIQGIWMEKAVCLRHEDTRVDTKVWSIPSSNCAARFVLAEWSQHYFAVRFGHPSDDFGPKF
jgi:hypothetical protein